LGWKVKEISIVSNIFEKNIRAIMKRIHFVMTLRFNTLVFHVKQDFITRGVKHGEMVSIMAGFVVLLGCLYHLKNLGMFA
jgi:hypothetical protein